MTLSTQIGFMQVWSLDKLSLMPYT